MKLKREIPEFNKKVAETPDEELEMPPMKKPKCGLKITALKLIFIIEFGRKEICLKILGIIRQGWAQLNRMMLLVFSLIMLMMIRAWIKKKFVETFFIGDTFSKIGRAHV